MIYVICVLVLFSACLLIKEYKNKYTYFFAIMTIGLIGMLMSSISLWKYDYTNMWLFKWDYKLLLKLAISKWYYRDLLDAFNVYIVVYMTGVQLFQLGMRSHKSLMRKENIVHCSIFALFCAMYLVFFDSTTAFEIYKLVVLSSHAQTAKILILALNWFFILVQSFYILSPAIIFLIKQRNEEFWIKRNQLIIFGIFMLVLDIFVIAFFVLGPLKNNYIDMSLDNFLGMRNFFRISTYQYITLVLVLCVYVVAILCYMLKSKILRTSASIRYKLAKRKWTMTDETREIFHMFKNILFNIELMSNQALTENSTEEKNDTLLSISQYCKNYIDEFFAITSLSKKVTYKMESVSVYDMIMHAIGNCHISDNINVKYECTDTKLVVWADFKTMAEAILNILRNAVESFENTVRDTYELRVKIRNDAEMVVIDVIDNGKGIKKKKLKNIFKPLYTSKSRKNNWGVGLAFVYKTIIDHGGHIRVTSKENEGTCVSIVLYRWEGKENG